MEAHLAAPPPMTHEERERLSSQARAEESPELRDAVEAGGARLADRLKGMTREQLEIKPSGGDETFKAITAILAHSNLQAVIDHVVGLIETLNADVAARIVDLSNGLSTVNRTVTALLERVVALERGATQLPAASQEVGRGLWLDRTQRTEVTFETETAPGWVRHFIGGVHVCLHLPIRECPPGIRASSGYSCEFCNVERQAEARRKG